MAVFFQLLANGLVAAALYGISAIGFGLVIRTGKFFNLAHGAFAVIGAYTAFAFVRLGLPFGWTVLLSLTAAVISGALSYALVILPLRRRSASSLVLLIATLGVFTFVPPMLAIAFGSEYYLLHIPLFFSRVVSLAGAAVTLWQITFMLIFVLLIVGTALFLRYTAFGKAVRAVSDDEEVSKIIGINTDRVVFVVILFAAFTAGLAGLFKAGDLGLEPTMGFTLLLETLIVAVVGGMYRLGGTVMGALVLGLAESFGVWFVPNEWKEAISFGILILFLLIRPQGILSR